MINKKNLSPIHPGKILKAEFLDPMGISAYRLSKDIGVQQIQISQIIHGKRPINAVTAVRLGLYFGNSTEFWLNLQQDYELDNMEHQKPSIKVIRPNGTEAVYQGRNRSPGNRMLIE